MNRIVLLEWVDVQSLDTGLIYPEDLQDNPVKCKIVGFLVKETAENYFLAKEIWENGMCKYIHIIPKKYVLNKKEVGV